MVEDGLAFVGALLAAIWLSWAGAAAAQTLTPLHGFVTPPANPQAGLVRGSDGNYYGTMTAGGAINQGVVFQITPGGTFTELHSFSGSDGWSPCSDLVEGTDGSFYGTTQGGGGTSGQGTVFTITPSGTLTTLHVFSGSDGATPVGGLLRGSDGNIYGTTAWGGANSLGTVFEITPGGTLTTLRSLSEADGSNPVAGLAEGSDGSFYGTTNQGGENGAGTVFSITSTGAFVTVHSFSGADGSNPHGRLVLGTDGYFYGTTVNGGVGGLGTVFGFPETGYRQVTSIHSFSGSDGSYPFVGLVQSSSNGLFYGTTPEGGANGLGTIFWFYPRAGQLTTIYSFAGSDGAYPYGSLVEGEGGYLYGTTFEGGVASLGTVFSFWEPGGQLTTLYSSSVGDGWNPAAGLAVGTDGYLYGTTQNGGTTNNGTFFRIAPAGALTTLASFSGTNGSGPQAGVVQGIDGYFYGTTFRGGAGGKGTVFRATAAGAVTTLRSFSGTDGANPSAGLVQGGDGTFYGTTQAGGLSNYGTVFKITPGGAFTTLRSFSYSEGATPFSALVWGSDGNLYGTTESGGTNGQGTVFSITPEGVLTTLHSFTSWDDGAYPHGSLVRGTEGDFYGTTLAGSLNDRGTVFRMTSVGALTTLYSFSGSDGGYPNAGLARGTDGSFYGTCVDFGPGNSGTIFKVTPAGALTTVRPFSSSGGDGRRPLAGLVQGCDGNLYGTTFNGGSGASGLVYALNVGLPPIDATITSVFEICAGSHGAAASVPDAGDGAVYVWTISGGAIVSGAGTHAIAFDPASTGTVVLNVTVGALGGCSRSGSRTIVIRPALGAPTATSNSPVCEGLSIGLNTGSVTGGVYSWTGPNGFTSSAQNPWISNATTAASGTYSVTVVANGCSSPAAATIVEVRSTPVISTVSAVPPNSTGWPASVPNRTGSTYDWYIVNGTITAGQGTNQITFTAGASGIVTISVQEVVHTVLSCTLPFATAKISIAPAASFHTVAPCRLFDTRNASGPDAASPVLAAGETRALTIGGRCAIPISAGALSVNVTVTGQPAAGELMFYRGDLPSAPSASTISFMPGRTRANNGFLDLSHDARGLLKVVNRSAGPTHLILDVNGYWETPTPGGS